MIEDTCANPSAEDADANFLNILTELEDVNLPERESTDEKVQNYIETVCGWEKSQHIPDLEDSGDSIADIPIMLEIIQDIQENSKDWKCKYRIYCDMHFQPDI